MSTEFDDDWVNKHDPVALSEIPPDSTDPILKAAIGRGKPDASFGADRYRIALGRERQNGAELLKAMEQPDPNFGFAAVKRCRNNVNTWTPTRDYLEHVIVPCEE